MQVEARFRAEELRTHHYLSSRTHSPLCRILESCLLTPHLSAIINMPHSGLDPMIDQDKLGDLSRLYKLFSMVDTGLKTLKRSLRDSVARRGKDINDLAGTQDSEGMGLQIDDPGEVADLKGKGKAKVKVPGGGAVTIALKWVEDVLALKDKFDRVSKLSFAGDTMIQTTLNEACLTQVELWCTLTIVTGI